MDFTHALKQPIIFQVVFNSSEAVVSQGDAHADRFYIVEEGELKAEIRGVPGEVCERLRCGSYFGERALIKVSCASGWL